MTHRKHACLFPAAVLMLLVNAACGPVGHRSDATESGGASGPPSKQVSDDDAVAACVAAYEHMFGDEGCLPGLYPPERFEVSCEQYAQWAARGEACGATAFSTFFSCLRDIECKQFDKNEVGYAEYPLDFDECQKQFARDMNQCIDESAEKQK